MPHIYTEEEKLRELTNYYPEYINEVLKDKSADEVVAMILDDGNKRRETPIKLPKDFQFFQCNKSPSADAYLIAIKHNKRRKALQMGDKSLTQSDGKPLDAITARSSLYIRIHKKLQEEFNVMVADQVETGFEDEF